jgi:hypothetical protein
MAGKEAIARDNPIACIIPIGAWNAAVCLCLVCHSISPHSAVLASVDQFTQAIAKADARDLNPQQHRTDILKVG